MILACISFALLILFYLMISARSFGRLPDGIRKKKIILLPNYKKDALQNLVETPMQMEGVGFGKIILKLLFAKEPNAVPQNTLLSVSPAINENPKSSSPEIIWFGHSSYLIKIDGKRILVDPVFSCRASPFSFMGPKAFKGTEIVKVEDFKNIDILLITHDHFDHLDYDTVSKIGAKVVKVVTSLGVGAHLEKWRFAKEKIIELAWNEEASIDGLKFTAVSARHFSGRRFKKNQTVWSAFMLKTKTNNLFLGGDSGYGGHFKHIGEKYGPFDLALLECGQYDEYWPYIHMFPEQTVQAAKELRAKILMPVHWGKFSLAMHPWNEPIKRVVIEANKQGLAIATPKIGETFLVNGPLPTEDWWTVNRKLFFKQNV